jgi:hypothetical protein
MQNLKQCGSMCQNRIPLIMNEIPQVLVFPSLLKLAKNNQNIAPGSPTGAEIIMVIQSNPISFYRLLYEMKTIHDGKCNKPDLTFITRCPIFLAT